MDPEEQQEIFARNIRRFREEAGLSQAGLAALVGVALNTVTKWEQRERAPSTIVLHRLAEKLGRPMEHFFLAAPPPVTPVEIPAFALQVIDKRVDPDIQREAEALIQKLNREHFARLVDRRRRKRPAPKS